MSSVYVLEPPTKGKVVFKTTAGGLDFELWPKEAPKAVRNFVQLCLEGYYDGSIFHRVIKTFMIQGGDPTGTGTGGDTIYGEPFADEFHSRLRFNHRGVLGCANAGTPNSNNSQFFMTLDRCDWLDKKHTIFGKVTGDTIYNMLKLGEVETGPDDRPLDPPQIISVEVLWNPFDDLVPRQLEKPSEAQTVEASTRRSKKPKKELNLLSFGEEAEEEEQQIVATGQDNKIKSSHDVLEDPRLLKSASDASQMDPAEAKRRKEVQISVRQALQGSGKLAGDASGPRNSRASRSPGSDDDDSGDDEADFDKKMREQIMEKKRMHAGVKEPAKKASTQATVSSSKSRTPSSRSGDASKSRNVETDDLGAKKEKLSIKKKGLGSEARAEFAATADSDMQLLTPLEQQRLKYKQRRKTLQGRAESTLGRLEKFAKMMKQTNGVTPSPAEEAIQDDNNDDTDWMAQRLEFVKDPAKQDDMSRNDDPNQYVVHDPLLEKGKEKFNKMQARMKRRNREWAGNSAT